MISSLYLALALLHVASRATAVSCPVADTSIIAHEGSPVGKEEVHNGGINHQAGERTPLSLSLSIKSISCVILLISDALGSQYVYLNSRLLHDREGCRCALPDRCLWYPAGAK